MGKKSRIELKSNRIEKLIGRLIDESKKIFARLIYYQNNHLTQHYVTRASDLNGPVQPRQPGRMRWFGRVQAEMI